MPELAEVIKDLEEVKEEVRDIKDNHLVHLSRLVAGLACEVNALKDTFKDSVRNMRWFITVALLIFAGVLALLQCFG